LETLLEFALVGFVAQLVDGALGMGFGVISAAVLLAQGVPPPLVSATVNAAKLPTGAMSAASHIMHRNVDWAIVRRIAISGALGGLAGAFLLISLKGDLLMLLIGLYLLLVGLLVMRRAIRGTVPAHAGKRRLSLIGGAAGLIEGIGGSWGPIATTGLLSAGVPPRQAIGSSNIAEFMVSFTVFAMLIATFHSGIWGEGSDWRGLLSAVGGLIMGGLPAALFGGYLARRLPRRPLSFAVGALAFSIGLWRLYTLI